MSDKKFSNDLVTLRAAETEFQASILVAVLEEAGIKAIAVGGGNALHPLAKQITPVLVQVRQRDLSRARLALEQNTTDSVDLDWDQVDFGERADDLPLTPVDNMPLIPKLGFIVAAAILALMILALVMLGLWVL